MTDDFEFVYRGTTAGWPGNPSLQKLRYTPTSSDPYIASLFALECSKHGRAIIQIAIYNEIKKYRKPKNWLNEIEQEVVVGVSPVEFAERFMHWSIGLEQARMALEQVGLSLPFSINGLSQLNKELDECILLSPIQRRQFNSLIIPGE